MMMMMTDDDDDSTLSLTDWTEFVNRDELMSESVSYILLTDHSAMSDNTQFSVEFT